MKSQFELAKLERRVDDLEKMLRRVLDAMLHPDNVLRHYDVRDSADAAKRLLERR